MRDEFPEDVKRSVAARAGFRCSNPSCRASTSGPQTSPEKSLNVGVAAHITAASPGGPRYNPTISSLERRGAENAIWLCQTCGKLVDNDSAQYSEPVIREWKADAEARAGLEVGKPAGLDLKGAGGEVIRLPVGARVQLHPTIPRGAEQDLYDVGRVGPNFIELFKESNQQTVEIPATGVGIVHKNVQRFTIVLQGRMQWVTPKQRWEFFPEGVPDGDDYYLGLRKPAAMNEPRVLELQALRNSACRWTRADKIARFLGQGWHVIYDADGRYFRVPGRDVDLIFMSQHP